VEVLGASGDPRVVDVLVGCLEDEDPNVRGTAAEALGEQGGAIGTGALIGCLEHEDRLLVLAALQSLNRLEAAVPWEFLAPIVDDPLFGADLLFVVARSGAPEAAPRVVAALGKEPGAPQALEILHSVSDAAAEAVETSLAGLDGGIRAALVRMAADGDPAEQRAAASCLLWSRPTDDIDIIIDIAHTETLYSMLLTELRRWGDEPIDALEQAIPELSGRRLASSIGLLTRLYDETADRDRGARLVRHLDDTDLIVATAAAGASARFGDVACIPRLLDLADEDEDRIRRVAGFALGEIGRRAPEETAEALAPVAISGKRGIQLCRVLEIVGDERDEGRLSAALGSPEPALRGAALRTLAITSGAGAVGTIALALTDEEPGVRKAAAESLARIGQPAAETIISALGSAEGQLKASLARALGRVGHPEAPEILKELCSGPAEVALAALSALGELDVRRDAGLETLVHAHHDSEVLKRALALLGPEVSTGQLVELVAHEAWDVRLVVVDLLAAKRDEPAGREALAGRLESERDDLVRRAIERALGDAGSEA
jgi:HEAT repeat protein